MLSENSANTTFISSTTIKILKDLSFEFKIPGPMPFDPNLHWNRIKNGVSKYSRKYNDYTIELVRSEKGEHGSAILIHLSEKYCFDWTRELINLYNLATKYARDVATQSRWIGVGICSWWRFYISQTIIQI